MNSLLLTEIFPPQTGGSGRWFWEIYRRLPRDRFVVAADVHPGQAEFDLLHDLRLVRLPVKLSSWGILGWRAFRDYCRLVGDLRRLIRFYGIDYIHCGKCLPEGLAARFLALVYRIPYLCYVHGEELSLGRQSRELAWWTQQVLTHAKLLIANSRNTALLLTREWQVPSQKLRVFHPGVDTTRFTPALRNPVVRARLGWGDRPVVLTVGRLQKRKGQDHMILALREIKKAVPDVLYAIVGDGEEMQSLQSLVATEKLSAHVAFLREIDDDRLIDCYQQCDLFALPNRQVGQDFEGFGMVLLEAQACGRPVLAGTSGGTAETMRIPQTGRVVACDDPGPLAAMVVELLSDRLRLDHMGAAGREWVVEQFDWLSLSRRAEHVFGMVENPRFSQ
jgi:phosphatidyl-myo-inositol dimannoside synthase